MLNINTSQYIIEKNGKRDQKRWNNIRDSLIGSHGVSFMLKHAGDDIYQLPMGAAKYLKKIIFSIKIVEEGGYGFAGKIGFARVVGGLSGKKLPNHRLRSEGYQYYSIVSAPNGIVAVTVSLDVKEGVLVIEKSIETFLIEIINENQIKLRRKIIWYSKNNEPLPRCFVRYKAALAAASLKASEVNNKISAYREEIALY